jgi:hypothetical protein
LQGQVINLAEQFRTGTSFAIAALEQGAPVNGLGDIVDKTGPETAANDDFRNVGTVQQTSDGMGAREPGVSGNANTL